MTTSTALSLPKSVSVRGYIIRKLPLGEYLKALEALNALPADLLSACFPGMSPGAVLDELKRFDAAALQRVIGRLMIAAPSQIIRMTAALTGIDEKALLEDPCVSLDGLAEIMLTWIEVNDLENFTRDVRALFSKTRTVAGSRKPSSGSSASLPRASSSGSQNERFWRTIFRGKSRS
jgi:hypothetical protein